MDVAGTMKICIINVAWYCKYKTEFLLAMQITDYNADGSKPFHLCFCSSLLHYDYIRYQLVVDVISSESPYSCHIVWRWRRNRIHSTKKVSLFKLSFNFTGLDLHQAVTLRQAAWTYTRLQGTSKTRHLHRRHDASPKNI